MKTVKETFVFKEDVMSLLGVSQSKAYAIIKQLNGELQDQGILTVQGRVVRNYFNKRFGLEPVSSPAKRKAKAAS